MIYTSYKLNKKNQLKHVLTAMVLSVFNKLGKRHLAGKAFLWLLVGLNRNHFNPEIKIKIQSH